MDRLTRRADFLAAASAAKSSGGKASATRASSAGFTVQCRDRGDTMPGRIGLTVSKKNGNAVRRNRIKRRLRAAVQTAGDAAFAPGHDYVLVARPEALRLPFATLTHHLRGALGRLARPT